MAHPDKSWRVAAIYRCCVRYGKSQEWAKEKLSELRKLNAEGFVIAHPSFPRIADIWFRRDTPTSPNHIEQARHAHRKERHHS